MRSPYVAPRVLMAEVVAQRLAGVGRIRLANESNAGSPLIRGQDLLDQHAVQAIDSGGPILGAVRATSGGRYMPKRSSLAALVAGAATLCVLAGCAKTARERPIQMGPVNTGAGSLEAVRRQLEGHWELVSLAVAPAGGGTLVPLEARGTLTYDEYGNLTVDAHTKDPNAPQAARSANLLAFSGRAVIDAARSELKLMDVTGSVDPNTVISTERRRRYAFEGDLLKLSSLQPDGQVAATATWRRR